MTTAAWCTGPGGTSLDVAGLITRDGNRWSRPGEPTLYLAGDPGVALAEFGRHWDEDRAETAVWSLRLALTAAADLRDAAVLDALDLPRDPTWIVDAERCRATASRLRSGGKHDGLIVPSMAFLDDPERWNAVVFVDLLETTLTAAIRADRAEVRLVRPAGDGGPD